MAGRPVESVRNGHRRCFRDGQYEQGVGIALESKRLDKLEEAVHRAPDTVAILRYALRVCQRVVASKDFRFQASFSLSFPDVSGLEKPSMLKCTSCVK